jgi:monoamine oxidase
MNDTDIIIVGAGAAGLICARELAKNGKAITILEARDRMGGRIHTITDSRFPLLVELGAEYMHGDLEFSKKVLKEAKIDYYEIKGDLWRSEIGEFAEQDDFLEDMDEIIKQLKKLPTDTSVGEFLDTYFGEEKYYKLRKTLKNYVEGYNASDLKYASSFALLQELLGGSDKQYRIKGGYIKLIEHLAQDCTKAGCIIKLEKIVQQIKWKQGRVEVVAQNETFTAKKIIITVPLGVLQSSGTANGQIIFSPAITEVQKAINKLGYGPVIKLIFLFEEPVWQLAGNIPPNLKKSEPSFIFSDAIIPTWWTQLPEKNGMITGWLAGPNAARLQNEPDDKILNLGLESLSVIFKIPRTVLLSKLISSHICNWSNDNFSKGAYSYEKVESKRATSTISEGVEDTIYFAGEAYHEGPESGTVEAALASGMKTAKTILQTASS